MWGDNLVHMCNRELLQGPCVGRGGIGDRELKGQILGVGEYYRVHI